MALITKPDMEFIWASGGAIVEPSDVKKQTGWTPEVPPHQWENWIQNRQDKYLAHINQRGIPEWDGNTEYEAGGLSYVQGTNGVVYKSVAASGPATTTQDPTTDVTDTYWTVAFASTTQATETVQGIVELATTAEAQAGTDDVRAMTPLKVKQAIAASSTVVLANPGRRITPDGLIEQWGVSPVIAPGTNVVITLPLTFPTAHLGVTTGGQGSGNITTPTFYGWEPISNSQFRIYNQSTQSGLVNWCAWGY